MNTPKKRKRASLPDLDALQNTPAILNVRVSDPVAAYIGLLVTQYTQLERKMIAVFRVILGIESGEAADLAYMTIKSPKARWDMVRQVLRHDQRHKRTSTEYDELIDEFAEITYFRNNCIHGLWYMDERSQPWLSDPSTPFTAMTPEPVDKAAFEQMFSRITALYDRILAVSEQDRRTLDRRWLGRLGRAFGDKK